MKRGKMPVTLVDRYNREEIIDSLQKFKSFRYVFGDNCKREGKGGQAKECRDLPNCIGIRTKFAPDMKTQSFFEDSPMCLRFVMEDLQYVWEMLFLGFIIILPKDGVGTGLANLPEKAPKIHAYIQGQFEAMQRFI